jgi:hypothetical protein
MRFWKVPKRRSILPLAWGLGATRWETPSGESTLKLRAGVAAISGGHMAKQGQAIGVERQGQAVEGKGAAEVLEVVPGGVGRHKDGRQELARVVIDRQQEGLLIGGGPPLVDGGVMLPQFAHTGPFPAAARLGGGRGGTDQEREVMAGVGGDGLAVALEGETGG